MQLLLLGWAKGFGEGIPLNLPCTTSSSDWPSPVDRRKAKAIAVIEEEAPDWMVSQSFKASFGIFGIFVFAVALWLIGCMNGDCGPKHPED